MDSAAGDRHTRRMVKKRANTPKQPSFAPTFIRAWRKRRGYTLEKLGAMIDMTSSALSMLERGERGYTQPTLELIAKALETDPSSLLAGPPVEKEAIWKIWETAKPDERETIVEIATSVTKRRAQ